MDCSLPDFRTILTRSCITFFYYFLPPSLLGPKSGSFSQVSVSVFRFCNHLKSTLLPSWRGIIWFTFLLLSFIFLLKPHIHLQAFHKSDNKPTHQLLHVSVVPQ